MDAGAARKNPRREGSSRHALRHHMGLEENCHHGLLHGRQQGQARHADSLQDRDFGQFRPEIEKILDWPIINLPRLLPLRVVATDRFHERWKGVQGVPRLG